MRVSICLCRVREQLAELLLDVSRAQTVELDMLLDTSLCRCSMVGEEKERADRIRSVRSLAGKDIVTLHGGGGAAYRNEQRHVQEYHSPLGQGMEGQDWTA